MLSSGTGSLPRGVSDAAADDDGRADERQHTDGHDRRQRSLGGDRFGAQVLGGVDAEQHDHEQEQHDDRAGVDDHLHGGEEVGLEGDEVHGDAEQREDQRQRRVHGVVAGDHADRADEHHRRGGDEDEQLDHERPSRSGCAGSAERTP